MQNKKAVSPIIATLILIIITILAGIIVYFYVAGYLSGAGSQPNISLSGGANAPGSGTIIFLSVHIKNDGTVPLTIPTTAGAIRADFVGVSLSTAAGSCTVIAGLSGTCTNTATPPFTSVTLTSALTLNPGESAGITLRIVATSSAQGRNVVVTVNANTPQGGTLTNQISLTISS